MLAINPIDSTVITNITAEVSIAHSPIIALPKTYAICEINNVRNPRKKIFELICKSALFLFAKYSIQIII